MGRSVERERRNASPKLCTKESRQGLDSRLGYLWILGEFGPTRSNSIRMDP